MTNEQIQQIYAWWNIFKHSTTAGGRPFCEIRIIGTYKTYSGYYANIDNLIRDVSAHENEGAVYFLVNGMKDSCYDKSQCETMLSGKVKATNDNDIIGYDYVFIDIDCEKDNADINSTDEEVEYAHKKALDVFNFLKSRGFYEPIIDFSANGYHELIPCRISNTPENRKLVERFTKALGVLFSDNRVHIDSAVANIGRLCKLPGTFSFKGSSMSVDRPQRMCKILRFPQEQKVNDIEYFRSVADEFFPEEEVAIVQNNYSPTHFSLDDFIQRHGIQVTEIVNTSEGRRYILDHCVFNPAHTGKDAMLFQYNSGAIAYKCFHSHCADKKWKDVRELFEPGCYDKQYSPTEKTYTFRKDQLKPTPEIETDKKGKKWKKMSEVPRVELNPADYIPTGIPQIDELIIGFKRKQVTLWSGYRGSAKSTLISQLILNSANLGYKSAIWTGELNDTEFKTWLYLQAAGKQYNKKSQYNMFYYTPKNVSEKIDPWMDNYLWLYNNEYSDNFNLLEGEIRDIVNKEGIDQVFLDNLTILDIEDLDVNEYKAQKEFMKRVHYLAIELNIHIHCIAHPNKSGGFLRMNNISGSGHLPDIAQNTMIIHRINRDFETASSEFLAKNTREDILMSGCTNCVEICKCRDKGASVGTFIKLYFELESNRLKNSIAEQVHYGWEDPEEVAIVKEKEENGGWTPTEYSTYQSEEDMPDFEERF